MEDLARNSYRADEDVYAVAILPNMSNLHQVEVAWLVQRANHAITYNGGELLALFFLQRPLQFILLLRGQAGQAGFLPRLVSYLASLHAYFHCFRVGFRCRRRFCVVFGVLFRYGHPWVYLRRSAS